MAPDATPREGPSHQQLDPGLFRTADYWHSAPGSQRVVPGFKEWSHFSILGADFDLLVNFSLMATARPPFQPIPRLTMLFRGKDGAWDGDVASFPPGETAIFEGSPDTVLGRNSGRFADGRYRIVAELPDRHIRAAFDLRPVVRPVIANNVRLSNAESVRWMVVPHLRGDGEVIAAGHRYQVSDAPAYHDRNWGRFAWGGAYAWEWATILPQDAGQPWSLVFSRIGDRQRNVTLSQSLILWRGAYPCRKFYGRDLSISHHGLLRHGRVLRLPRVAALPIPGTAADVPREIVIAAQGYGDALTLRLRFDDFAQVIVPNDRWPGFTALCEITGRADVSGRIGDEQVAFDARVQAELNHEAA